MHLTRGLESRDGVNLALGEAEGCKSWMSTKIGSHQKQSPTDNTGGRTNTSASRYNHIRVKVALCLLQALKNENTPMQCRLKKNNIGNKSSNCLTSYMHLGICWGEDCVPPFARLSSRRTRPCSAAYSKTRSGESRLNVNLNACI